MTLQEATSHQKLMDPAQWAEMSHAVPLAQRPQAWWDLLSILAGALSGYLWFVYGSVRGLPYPAFMRRWLGRENWMDFLPAMALIALGVAVVFARQTLADLLAPLSRKLSGLPWEARVILTVPVLALVYYLSNFPNPIFMTREGLDIPTPLIMTAMPLLFVWFRRELDLLLLPIQGWKRHIPKLVLLGIGMAIPFLTAWIIYRFFGIRQYPLLRTNVVVGMFLSYLVVRTPQDWGKASTGDHSLVRTSSMLILGLILLQGFPALADDFARDPFNLNDGLRTDGVAPILAGGATAVVSVFVNGVEVVQALTQSGVADVPPPTPPPTDLVLTDSLGRTHQYELDPKSGKYINILTGGELDPDRWDEYNKNLISDKAFTDQQRQKLEQGETAQDRALRDLAQRQQGLNQQQQALHDQLRQALAEKQIQLEKDRLDSLKNLNSWQIGKTISLAGNEVATSAKWTGAKTFELGKTIYNDPDSIRRTYNDVKDVAKALKPIVEIVSQDLKNKAWDAVTHPLQTTQDVGNAVVNTVKSPGKFLRYATGYDNFGNALDPNKGLGMRIANVGIGVFKVATSASAAQKGTLAAIAAKGLTTAGGYSALEKLEHTIEQAKQLQQLAQALGLTQGKTTNLGQAT
jgi:hypothetical protein